MSEIEEVHSFDSNALEGPNINMLAKNVAKAFGFPTDRYKATANQTFLKATECGMAQFWSFDVKTPLHGQGCISSISCAAVDC